LTLGLDWRWRRKAAREILRGSPARFLDLGCGTGDLAVEVARRSGSGLAVTGVDFVPAMLESAGIKARNNGVGERIKFVAADAASLPFPDGSFDAVGLAFSFRNLTHRNPSRERHLAEIYRVLRPGGKLVIVETSQPRNPFIRAGFHAYMRLLVGPIGGLISDRAAYRYLAESAAAFMPLAEATTLLEHSAFSVKTAMPLLFGVASLIVGIKPLTPERKITDG